MLAYVLVPQSATSITTGDILNVAKQYSLPSSLNYLRLPAAAPALMTWGLFTTGTGSISNAGSKDWTVGSLSTGQATVTFPARSPNPAVYATVDIDSFSGAPGYAAASQIAAGTAVVSTYLSSSDALSNALVSFMVLG